MCSSSAFFLSLRQQSLHSFHCTLDRSRGFQFFCSALLAMAGNHPDEWDTAAQWEWPQWQDSNRWEWQARKRGGKWEWHRRQWDNGSEWRHWDRPAIPAPEDQEKAELSQPLIRNLGECGAADIEAIRRRTTIQAWEARSDPATPETAVAADELPVIKRVRFNGIPAQYIEEHPIPYKAAPTGKEYSGVQVKAAPAGVPFKAAPAGVPLIRWPCKAPPQGVKPPQPPGVDQLQRVPYKVDVRPPHACGGILMGATPSFDSNTFLISSTASPSTHNTFLLAACGRSLEVLQEASSSSGNIQCFPKNWMLPDRASEPTAAQSPEASDGAHPGALGKSPRLCQFCHKPHVRGRVACSVTNLMSQRAQSPAAQSPAAQWLNAPTEAHPGSCRPCWFTAKGKGCHRNGCLFCHKPHVTADVRLSHGGGRCRQRVAMRNGRDDSCV